MQTHSEVPKENKATTVADKTPRNTEVTGIGMVDNRPEAIAQRKLQETMHSSSEEGPVQLMKESEYATLDKNLKDAPQVQGNRVLDRQLRIAVMRSIEETLNPQNFVYRFGGSTAAMLHGGKRVPNDIDIDYGGQKNEINFIKNELGSSTFMSKIQAKLPADKILVTEISKGSMTVIYAKDVVMTQRFPNLSMDVPVGPVRIDYAWEPNLASEAGFKSALKPNEAGGVVTPQEVLSRYFDRMIKKPSDSAEKKDMDQINAILTAKDEFWMTSLKWYHWMMQGYDDDTTEGPSRQKYQEAFEEVAKYAASLNPPPSFVHFQKAFNRGKAYVVGAFMDMEGSRDEFFTMLEKSGKSGEVDLGKYGWGSIPEMVAYLAQIERIVKNNYSIQAMYGWSRLTTIEEAMSGGIR